MGTQILENLKTQRNDINAQFLKTMCNDSKNLKILADNMAEAATNIQGQGYGAFVNAREAFLTEVDRILEDYSLFMCHETSSKSISPK
jgi:hypothetical protein